MSLRVVVRDQAVDVEIRGFASVMCLAHDQHLPLADLTGVRVTGWDEPRSQIGWRVAGGYLPGWFATGWYTAPGRPGARQLWSVYRQRDQLLVIDTDLERPCRLVLAVPGAERLAEEINRRIEPFR